MQPLLAFLVLSIYVGFRSDRVDRPVSHRALLIGAVLLSVALYSRRFLI